MKGERAGIRMSDPQRAKTQQTSLTLAVQALTREMLSWHGVSQLLTQNIWRREASLDQQHKVTTDGSLVYSAFSDKGFSVSTCS